MVLTNESGNKTKSYSYNAFGVEYNEATLDDNPFRYCGEYYDKETKTIYLRARYYNAEQGRFTQEDPIRDGYNWYAYCGGNPINYIDPSGYNQSYLFIQDIFYNFINIENIKKINWFMKKMSPLFDQIKDFIKENIIRYDVPLYNQGDLSLCWAYCQTMVEDYQNQTSKNKQQADDRAKEIAISVHGETDENGVEIWNQGGFPTNRGKQIEPQGIEYLFELLQDGPIYAYYWNGKMGQDGMAHLVVVTGVNLLTGTVYTNNPWGCKGAQTYDEFLNGCLGMPSSYEMSLYYLYLIEYD